MNPSPPISSSAIDRDNPWPGLAPFTEDQGAYFHGRDDEIDDLTQLARLRALVVLFGQSGLGKSSLLQAGVFPRLRANGFCPVYIRLDHAENAPSPTEQIRTLLLSETAKVGTWTKPGMAKPGETLWELFHHRDDRLIGSGGRPIIPVLVFDQFEELFTLGAAAGGRRDRAVAFMSELAELVENRPSEQLVARLEASADELEAFDFSRADYRVVITLREDFLPELEGLKTIMPAMMANRMRLARMTGTQALQAVVKPGAALVTEEVACKIVEFVAGARGGSIERLAELNVEPALLSVVCRELNERRRALGQAQITADLVSGNRREILTDFYDRSVNDLPAGMRSFVEDRLLTKSGFRDNLALETALEEPDVTQALIDTLVSRRLLRLEDRAGIQRVELTHDVLAEVIRASRDTRQQRLALETAERQRRRDLAVAARQTRRQRFAIAGLALAVVALSIGAVFGLRAQRRAAQQAADVDLSIGSRLLDEGNTGDGLAYLAAAARRDQDNNVAATRIVSTLVARNFLLPVGATLTLPSPGVYALILADGRSALVQCADSRVLVIDLAEWKVAREFSFEKKLVPQGLRVAANNSDLFAVAFADGTVQVCDTATGRPRGKSITPPNLLSFAQNIRFRGIFAFSPDGRWLATHRGTTAVFDSASGEERFHGEHFNGIMQVDKRTWNPFSSDSSRVALPILETDDWQVSAIRSSASMLLSVPDGGVLVARRFEDTFESNGALQFSADGTRMLMVGWKRSPSSNDETNRIPHAVVCDASTLQPIGPAIPFFQHHYSNVFVLTPAGTRVVVNLAGERAARVYDVKTGQLAFPELPHGATFTSIGISEDSAVYATNSIDGQIRLWDLRTGALFAEPTLKLDRRGTAALSRDGRTLLVFSATGAAHRLDVTRGPAAPLVLPRPPSSTIVHLVEKPPARALYFSNTAATMVDVASGRQIEGGFALPQRIRSVNSVGGEQTLRPGDHWIARTAAAGRTLWTWGESGPPRESAFAETFPDGASPVPVLSSTLKIAAIGNRPVGGSRGATQSSIALWDLRTGKKIAEITGGEVALAILEKATDFSSDDQRFVLREAADDGALRVYGIRDGKLLFQLPSEGGATFLAARFNRDGTRLLTGNALGTLQIWDGVSGKPLQSIQAHRYGLECIDFSGDGRYYATGSADGTAQVRDAATHEPVGAPLVHVATVNRTLFNADNARVVSTANGVVRVWDVRTGLPLNDPIKHDGGVGGGRTLGLSSDGRFLSTLAGFGNVRATLLWATPPTGPADRAPAWLVRLATVCAGRRLNESGKLVSALDEFDRFDDLRREIAGLADDAPYAAWGKWFLSTDAARPIAPGFTVTPAEAKKLEENLVKFAMEGAPPPAPGDPAPPRARKRKQ